MYTADAASFFILMEHSLPLNKETLRQTMRARRKLLTQDVDCNAALIQAFSSVFEHCKAKVVAGYYPLGGEISPLPLLDYAAQHGAQTALPIIRRGIKQLSFAAYQGEDTLCVGEYGTLQPAEGKTVTPDLLICPLVAFDGQGHRLGQGGGYYDVTLAHLRKQGAVMAIGLAYAEQECDTGAFAVETHDQKMDVIITPTGIKDFR